jgi:transglutaminase/protease-like cytokinesis protein 3
VYETQDASPTTAGSVLETQDDVPMARVVETQDIPPATTQPDRTRTAKVNSGMKKPKPATASTTAQKDTTKLTTKNVGSQEKLEKERAEDERKERQIKQVIEGICRGC